MTRSVWKGFVSEMPSWKDQKGSSPLLDSSSNIESISRETQKIVSRSSLISPDFLDKKLQVYNGRFYVSLKVSEEMIGHKFGEFAATRKLGIHKKKVKKKK